MDLWVSPHDFRVRSLKTLSYGFTTSPFGDCIGLAAGPRLVALHFCNDRREALQSLQLAWPKLTLRHGTQADALIAGVFQHPEEVPVMGIGTPFQLTVWEFLRTIPSSATMTYGEVARAIGRPNAARAVGRAVGVNEIAVAIPCHRVVSRGSLTGYRWGLERKKQLLAREFSSCEKLSTGSARSLNPNSADPLWSF